MPVDKKIEIRGDGPKSTFFAFLISTAIRLITLTLRIEFIDHAGLPQRPSDKPLIFLLWHNRIFSLPALRHRQFACRPRMTVLTSASRDGAVLEKTVRIFGLQAVRGSSSRRAVAALVALKKAAKNGSDLVITPDGPRGPRYQIQPGALKLSQVTGAPLIPIQVHYHRAKSLNTWDRFQIPLPFSKVTVTLHPPISHQEGDDPESTIQSVTQALSTDS